MRPFQEHSLTWGHVQKSAPDPGFYCSLALTVLHCRQHASGTPGLTPARTLRKKC